MSVVSPTDVWALGSSSSGRSSSLAHFDGRTWTVVGLPGASGATLSAAGPRDVWAVGGSFVGAVCRSPARPLAYHFVSAWKAAPFAGSGAAVARIQPDC